jgi:hypothetical protein
MIQDQFGATTFGSSFSIRPTEPYESTTSVDVLPRWEKPAIFDRLSKLRRSRALQRGKMDIREFKDMV